MATQKVARKKEDAAVSATRERLRTQLMKQELGRQFLVRIINYPIKGFKVNASTERGVCCILSPSGILLTATIENVKHDDFSCDELLQFLQANQVIEDAGQWRNEQCYDSSDHPEFKELWSTAEFRKVIAT